MAHSARADAATIERKARNPVSTLLTDEKRRGGSREYKTACRADAKVSTAFGCLKGYLRRRRKTHTHWLQQSAGAAGKGSLNLNKAAKELLPHVNNRRRLGHTPREIERVIVAALTYGIQTRSLTIVVSERDGSLGIQLIDVASRSAQDEHDDRASRARRSEARRPTPDRATPSTKPVKPTASPSPRRPPTPRRA